MKRTWITFLIGLALSMALMSAAAESPIPLAANRVAVGLGDAWTDTGFDVRSGDAVTVLADGRMSIACRDKWGQGPEYAVGPEGTFSVNELVADQRFPLASGNHGPAPCFSLIGRIGNGEPFFVGRAMSITAPASGRLSLRVNAFSGATATGCWNASIETGTAPSPLWRERIASPGEEQLPSVRPERVIVFYVDGLRPDVARQMVGMGHLPTIRELFVDGGVWLKHNVTAFPSDTITSNGTMWTGCFSDRHGLKAQVRFSRDRCQSESYLEPLGPGRSSKLLAPVGIDRALAEGEKQLRSAVSGPESGSKWYQRNVTEVPPLYSYLRGAGKDWATGVLPIMTEVPPLLWTRSLTRELPWFESHNAWQYVDDANANYAIRHLLQRNSPVTVLWFPETDSASHKCQRGQFGATRRTIAQADQLLERIVAELHATGRLESTCFMLVSDHGHHGGRTTHLRHFDIANELLFPPRLIDQTGHHIGGGLGLSVRMHRFWNRHPEHHQREFVFVDGDSSGVARIFLPRRAAYSRDWSRPNRPGDLLKYEIADTLPPIDFVATLANAKSSTGESTVDLVLTKLDDASLLITTCDRGQAVIDRRCNEAGQWIYRYRTVTKVSSDDRGGILYSVGRTERDPLRLVEQLGVGVLNQYFDEQAWLRLTVGCAYPDCVVALTRHLLWQNSLRERESEYAPDIVITARPGWYFGTASTPGTNHGYPLADAMHACWFVSGPGIRRGSVIETPSRLVDLTPTILDMLGVDTPAGCFDGVPRREIYDTLNSHENLMSDVTWQQLDLGGWGELHYQPIPDSRYKPLSVNRPEKAIDLNNGVYNIVAIADMSIFRILDDIVSPLATTQRPGTAQLAIDRVDNRLRQSPRPILSSAQPALNVPEVAISDYTVTSLGNLKRVSGAIDWIQGRGQVVDRRVAEKIGKEQTASGSLVNQAVDTAQYGVWEAYRFGQRIIVQTLDETLLNGIENTADRTVNGGREVPAEIRVLDE